MPTSKQKNSRNQFSGQSSSRQMNRTNSKAGHVARCRVIWFRMSRWGAKKQRLNELKRDKIRRDMFSWVNVMVIPCLISCGKRCRHWIIFVLPVLFPTLFVSLVVVEGRNLLSTIVHWFGSPGAITFCYLKQPKRSNHHTEGHIFRDCAGKVRFFSEEKYQSAPL